MNTNDTQIDYIHKLTDKIQSYFIYSTKTEEAATGADINHREGCCCDATAVM